MFFLPHPAKEQAKILWKDGAAVAFYSVKMKGEGHMAYEVEGGVGIPGVCPSLQTRPWHWHSVNSSGLVNFCVSHPKAWISFSHLCKPYPGFPGRV